jgi:hypothetical protein
MRSVEGSLEDSRWFSGKYKSEDEASMGPDCNLHAEVVVANAMAVALKPLFYWAFCNSSAVFGLAMNHAGLTLNPYFRRP